MFLSHFSLNAFGSVLHKQTTIKYVEPEVQIQGIYVYMVRQMGKWKTGELG